MKHRKRILLWLSRLAFIITLICSHSLLHTESDKIFSNAVAMGGLMLVLGYYYLLVNSGQSAEGRILLTRS